MAFNMEPTPPHSTTPKPIASGRGHHIPKDVPRSFHQLQKNDRAAIRKCLTNLIQAPKWKQMTSDDRRAGMRKAINDQIEQRHMKGNARTVRREYPDEWDLEGEIQHFLRSYDSSITRPTEGDDAEDLPTVRGRFKREPKDEYEDSEMSDGDSEDGEDELDSEDESEDGEDRLDTGPAFKVVARDFVISTKDAPIGGYHMVFKTYKPSKVRGGSIKGRVQPSGIAKTQPWKAVKRGWRLVDGILMVWLPSEAFDQPEEAGQGEKKLFG